MDSSVALRAFSPELILLLGGCVTLFLGVTRIASRVTTVSATAFGVIFIALLATLAVGSPDTPIAFPGLLCTPLTFYVRIITLAMGLLIILANWHQPVVEERGEYMSLIIFSLLGVTLTASTNDLLLLFFAVELVSVPTYVLVALSRPLHRAAEASVKYFFLGALAAAIFAYGLTFLYGASGTTTMMTGPVADLLPTLAGGGGLSTFGTVGLLLVFAGMAFKIAAVPFHVYAPDVYEGAAAPITGMLGFVPKLAGFLALVKVFAACGWELPVSVMWLMWIVAALTMTVGNVLALLQHNVKRILAYSSIAHTGYMLIALLVGPASGEGPMRDGVAALLFYVAIYGAMNLGAFVLVGMLRYDGQEVESLEDLGGLARHFPLASLGLAVCVFSLMGFPPLAGFLGKVYVFSSAFSLTNAHPMQMPLIVLAVIGVANSAIAAAYYLRIVSAPYLGSEIIKPERAGGMPGRLALALCSIAMIVFFAWPAGLVGSARSATAEVAPHETVQQASVAAAVRLATDD